MNEVDPIRDMEKVRDIASYLRGQSERNYLLFMFGVYTGLRISDILRIKVRDVANREHFVIREEKTNKENKVKIPVDLKKVIKEYVKGKKDYEFLFQSSKGANAPITRIQAYRILKDAAIRFNLCSIGTHTLRKTFGYHLYKKTKDAVLVMKALNHSEPKTTLRYIGIEKETVEEAIAKLSFM